MKIFRKCEDAIFSMEDEEQSVEYIELVINRCSICVNSEVFGLDITLTNVTSHPLVLTNFRLNKQTPINNALYKLTEYEFPALFSDEFDSGVVVFKENSLESFPIFPRLINILSGKSERGTIFWYNKLNFPNTVGPITLSAFVDNHLVEIYTNLPCPCFSSYSS